MPYSHLSPTNNPRDLPWRSSRSHRGTNVKAAIQSAYDGDPDLMYVQLVGDWEDIQCDTNARGYPKDNALGEVTGDDYYDLIISRFSAGMLRMSPPRSTR